MPAEKKSNTARCKKNVICKAHRKKPSKPSHHTRSRLVKSNARTSKVLHRVSATRKPHSAVSKPSEERKKGYVIGHISSFLSNILNNKKFENILKKMKEGHNGKRVRKMNETQKQIPHKYHGEK